MELSGQDYPVMLWIHGGGLETEASNFFDPEIDLGIRWLAN
jgi:carboxylesterase type B